MTATQRAQEFAPDRRDELNLKDQNALVAKYTQLVRRIAYHLMSKLPPNVQADDLIQSGMIGLLEASKNYNPGQGASFETYAGIRIRGAMLDEIRRGDWAPRSLHRKMRQVTQAIRGVELREGRDARDVEVAESLDMTLGEYHQILKDATSHKIFSFDALIAGEESLSSGITDGCWRPEEEVEDAEFRRCLAEAIGNLPERERLVMSLYYEEELNLREIGVILNVSESRVCQIHGQAMLRVKSRMSDWRKA
jgi:RNA polymerase sigma factor FliA